MTATILEYTDYKEVIIVLLLRLSHKARAYIANARGLPGFLLEHPITTAFKSDELKWAMQW